MMSVLSRHHLRAHYRYLAEAGDLLKLRKVGPYLCLSAKDPRYACNFVVGGSQEHDEGVVLADALAPYEATRTTQSLVWFADRQASGLLRRLGQHGVDHVADLSEVVLDFAAWRQQGAAEVENERARDFGMTPVASERDYEAWCEVHAKTWGRSLAAAKYLFRTAYHSPERDGRLALYIVRQGANVVAGTMLDVQGDIAGCYRTAVLPEYRRQGLARKILQCRLQIARQRGCRYVIGQCSSSSLGMYLQHGFMVSGEMALLRRNPSV